MAASDILVILRPGDRPAARLEFAARLARQEDVRVQGMCLEEEPPTGISDCWAIGPAAVCDVLEHRQAEEAQAIAPLRNDFLHAMAKANVRAEVTIAKPLDTPTACVARAPTCQLVLLRQPEEHDPEQRHLVETLVVHGQAPCLIMQDEAHCAPEFNSVVVGWDGGVHVRRALQAALPLLEPGARVELHTVGAPEDQADDDTCEVLARLKSLGLDAQSCRSTSNLSSAGYALLRRCDIVRADLLVMGAFSHPPTLEALLGGATRTALLRAQIPLLLAH